MFFIGMFIFRYICINFIAMDIQIQRSIIIEQFNKVTDINLINAIQSMLDYGLSKEEEFTVPEEHQDIVIGRFKKSRKKPERLLDRDEAKKTLINQ